MHMVRREVAGVSRSHLTAGSFWEVRQSDVGVVFPLGPSKNQGQVVEVDPLDKNPDYHWTRPTLDAWLDGIILKHVRLALSAAYSVTSSLVRLQLLTRLLFVK